ncbi:glutathionylspermidine synthase family protein [Oryzicola mucosus]|uniref:Glutathionylspermidine synthase family protein n=1 Tax=Oryzicola mucosus TaxID=2767425 RepID=A0A8J6U051_9HYPH|nr:glutathionylspermidine synthase family protein [Oryzicola mucosus]MBD0415106.1 glutathionylspermidine synthase family protein [Oryzicola mucosus]
MERIAFEEREDWRTDAEACGFNFHTMYGARYWDERHAYCFSLEQIETDIEDPTAELMSLCYEAAGRIVNEPALMDKLAIPADFHASVKASWDRSDYDLYGRFDFAYDGKSPAKMLEFNADTPTSLFESAVFQWRWLEAMKASRKLAPGADQFNSLHEKLVAALPKIAGQPQRMHFAAISDSVEDWGTVEYLVDCAVQAGLEAVLIDIAHIGVDAHGWFTDGADRRIETLFKLYPLEDMVREDFGAQLKKTPTRLVEPLWKLVLSNKGLLPILWEMYEGHPNLLPAFFDDDPAAASLGDAYVRKPLLSREGANVTIVDPAMSDGGLSVEGEYGAEGYVRQALHLVPQFGEDWTVIGSWVVAGQPAGIGIREDATPVTRNTSRFVPHFIL